MTNTPLVKIDNFYLKREDKNITGSAKDRAISVQVKNLINQGYKEAVISSTGNAAISAQYFCSQNNIKLTVFVSPGIHPSKLKLLAGSDLHTSSTPISDAFKYSKNGAYFLRQSTDPSALTGYQEIGKELLRELPDISSIFIPVGSGTTLLGISQALSDNIKIFAVQPASHAPIASVFDSNFLKEDETVTDALSVKLLPLKNKVIEAIKNHQGSALVVQNQQVIDSQSFLLSKDIDTSPEGALALAGFNKALQNCLDPGPNPVIILTGADRHA